MAPGENWTTMRHKLPSSPKPSAQLPAKQLTPPLLPLFPPSSASRPASTTSSAECAADGCPSPISYWDQPERSDYVDNTIYCDSTGCSSHSLVKIILYTRGKQLFICPGTQGKACIA